MNDKDLATYLDQLNDAIANALEFGRVNHELIGSYMKQSRQWQAQSVAGLDNLQIMHLLAMQLQLQMVTLETLNDIKRVLDER